MSAISIDAVEVVKNRYAEDGVVDAYSTTELFPAEATVFTQFLKPGSTILDLGCGAGRTTIDLARRGYHVEGIDFAPKMIDAAKLLAARQDSKIEFHVKDATKLDYAAESFDNIIFSYNGLEQIPGKENRLKVINDAYRILKPGGYFMFTTRSGLAFASRRALVWFRIIVEYAWYYLIKGDHNWEFGDTIRKGNYFNYTNPFKVKENVVKLGFKLRFFNSENNILANRQASKLTNFSNARMLFYVFQKPEANKVS